MKSDIDLEKNFVPEELLKKVPENATIIAVAGLDLEDLEIVDVEIRDGKVWAPFCCYVGPDTLPSTAVKLEVTYFRENWNACWYVIKETPRIRIATAIRRLKEMGVKGSSLN